MIFYLLLKKIIHRKISFSIRIFLFLLINCFGINIHSSAQSNVANKYGLYVIADISSFKNSIAADTNKRMINIQNCLPGIIADLRYATSNNFMKQKLYPAIHTSYLRLAAVNALKKVVDELRKENLTLKIFDAYRPYSTTEKMWEVVKDDRYAADPAKGSGHNRGIAVDLTLVDIITKKELPMGTGFDNFSDTAHTDFTALPSAIMHHRNILKSVMEKYGFISLDTEWWHFSLPNAKCFELLDLSFDQLKKIDRHR
ncbi:MAG: M15 family metallopeptidase [Ginsengibacter sp.]